jgi:hypothetical protein
MDASTQAVNAVYQGNLIECSEQDWPAVRAALQSFAGTCIDSGDGVRAMIALEEVKRLDQKFSHEQGEE